MGSEFRADLKSTTMTSVSPAMGSDVRADLKSATMTSVVVDCGEVI